MSPPRLSSKTAALLLGCLLAFHLAGNLVWIDRDESYPRGDETLYLRKAVNLYNILRGDGDGWGRRLLFADPISRVPVFPAFALPFFVFLGPTYDAACVSNFLFLAGMIVFTYLAGARLEGRGTGLAAAALLSFYPFVMDYSRNYWSDPALIAALCLCFWLLLRTDLFRNTGAAALWGLAAGSAILIKQLAAFYLLPMLVPAAAGGWVLETRRLEKEGAGRLKAVLAPTRGRLNPLLAVLIALALALPYYLVHREEMRTVFEFGEASGYWTPVADRLDGSFWTWYLGGTIQLTGRFLFGAFLAGFVLALLSFRKKYLLLLAWLAGSYLVVSFFEAKLARYISGLLPPLALFTAIGLSKIRPRFLRAAAGATVAAGCLAGFAWVGWDLSPGTPPDWLRGEKSADEVWRLAFDWPRAPEQCGDWRVADIVRRIKEDSGGGEKLLFVVPYLRFFFPESFRTFVALEGVPVTVEGPGSPYAGFNYRFLIEADYLVAKSGEQARDELPRLAYVAPAAELLEHPPEQFERSHETLAVFPLPDGSEAVLLKRTRPASARERVEVIRRCLEIDPDHVWAWNALGEDLIETGRPGEAREAFHRVIRCDPSWPGGYLGVGRSFLAEENPAPARPWIEKSLEIAPDWPFARFVMGRFQEATGDLEGARRNYRFAADRGKFGLGRRAQEALENLERDR